MRCNADNLKPCFVSEIVVTCHLSVWLRQFVCQHFRVFVRIRNEKLTSEKWVNLKSLGKHLARASELYMATPLLKD